ncbi:MAG: hypothetical protein ACRCZS_01825 [Chroococcidiopsis sp.]
MSFQVQDRAASSARLSANVAIAAHQAFFTRNALESIATTLSNITKFEQGQPLKNEIVYQLPTPTKAGVEKG